MVYIVFVLFLIITVYTIVKKYWMISTYIVGIYAFMMFFAILLAKVNNTYAQYSYTCYLPSVLFVIILLFYFTPYFKEKPQFIHDESDLFLIRFSRVGYVISIIIIVGMLFLFPTVVQSLTSGLGSIRRAMYLEEATNISYGFFGNIGQRILSRAGWLGYTNLLMFFYSLVYIKKKVLLKVLLAISSLGPLWLGILNGGRTNTVYWAIYLFFCIALFYKEFNFKHKRKVFLLLLVAALVLGRYFIFATAERVSVNINYSSSSEFLLIYTGQPFANFNYYFSAIKWHPYTFRRELPYLTSLLFGKLNLTEYRAIIQSHTGVLASAFSTFLGTIYVDTGIIGLALYTFVYNICSRKLMKFKEFNLTRLIYLGILCQIPLMGVFYYSYYKAEISIQIVIMILLARYMDLNKKPFVIKFGSSRSIKL